MSNYHIAMLSSGFLHLVQKNPEFKHKITKICVFVICISQSYVNDRNRYLISDRQIYITTVSTDLCAR